MVFFPSRLFGFGPRQVFLILVACGVCASASDTISVCFFGFLVCFLASFFCTRILEHFRSALFVLCSFAICVLSALAGGQ